MSIYADKTFVSSYKKLTPRPSITQVNHLETVCFVKIWEWKQQYFLQLTWYPEISTLHLHTHLLPRSTGL